MLKLTRRYQKDSLMVARKIAGELILVPIRQNVGDLQCMYTLSEVGSRIWELLDDGRTVADIVLAITEEYEVEASQAEDDLADFLTQLEAIGVIAERPEGD